MLVLVKHGVPWDVALNLSPAETLGYIVAIGELDGGKFSWGAMDWEKPS